MIAYVKHLKPGGETFTTNHSDSRLVLNPNDGIVVSPFGEYSLPSYTCRHCNQVMPISSVHQVVDHCSHCQSPICQSCVQKLWTGEDICRPFKEEGGDADLIERGLFDMQNWKPKVSVK